MASWRLSPPPGDNANNNTNTNAVAPNGQNDMPPPRLHTLPPLYSYGITTGRSGQLSQNPIPMPPPPGTRLPLIMSPLFQTPSYLPPTPSYAPGDAVGGPLPALPPLTTLDSTGNRTGSRGPALAPITTPGTTPSTTPANSPPPSVHSASPPAASLAAAPSATPSSAGSAALSAASSATPSAHSAPSTRAAASSAAASAASSATSSAALPAVSRTTTKKRKSTDSSDNVDLFPTDVEFIDWGDDRLALTPSDTCNLVRRKINNWILSGAMKVGEFQRAIGVSAKGYSNFMNRTGTWDGENCDAFHQAHRFFKTRELQGLPLKAPKPKKAKTADGDGADAASSKAAVDAL